MIDRQRLLGQQSKDSAMQNSTLIWMASLFLCFMIAVFAIYHSVRVARGVVTPVAPVHSSRSKLHTEMFGVAILTSNAHGHQHIKR